MIESNHSVMGILSSHKITFVIYWVKNRKIFYKGLASEDRLSNIIPNSLPSQLIILITFQEYMSSVMFILTVCWLGQESKTLNNN